VYLDALEARPLIAVGFPNDNLNTEEGPRLLLVIRVSPWPPVFRRSNTENDFEEVGLRIC
jgi:hypothetical protein